MEKIDAEKKSQYIVIKQILNCDIIMNKIVSLFMI